MKHFVTLLFIIMSWLVFVNGCQHKVDMITFPDNEARAYADEHFHENIYREHEYMLAVDPQFGDSGVYNKDFETWNDEEWDKKIHFLPWTGFTHDLPAMTDRSSDEIADQQYYKVIGKYTQQFGFGWDAHPDDYPPDDPETPWFDGKRTYAETYRRMW